MNTILVGTDGSAINNPHGPAGWAWVVDSKSWNAGSFPQASNQVAEMFAVYRALLEIPPHYSVHIQTDSRFVVNMMGKNGLSGWLQAWKRNGWRKGDGKIPANLNLVKKLDEVARQRQGRIRLEWVKGHSTNKLNQVADRMCTIASAHQRDGKTFKGPGWVTPALTARQRIDLEIERRKLTAPKKEQYTPIGIGAEPGFLEPVRATEFCPSCDGPINAQGECRCSY